MANGIDLSSKALQDRYVMDLERERGVLVGFTLRTGRLTLWVFSHGYKDLP